MPPLSASVTVTVGPVPEPLVEAVDPVAEQFVYGAGQRDRGRDGDREAAGEGDRDRVAAPQLRREPLEVKPTVQVERVLSFCGEPVNVTAVGVVAAAIVTLAPGLAMTVSALVFTDSWFAVIVVAITFCTPAIVSAPLALLARAQVPPLSASVIVIVGPELRAWALVVLAVVAVAEQFT